VTAIITIVTVEGTMTVRIAASGLSIRLPMTYTTAALTDSVAAQKTQTPIRLRDGVCSVACGTLMVISTSGRDN
jgi:hypothetical protein